MRFCFCSWSGGKDCCLALFKAVQAGYSPRALLTMCIETGGRSRSHGLSLEILQAQAKSLGILLFTQDSSWQNYRDNFISALRTIKVQEPMITTGIFGDIDIDGHETWEQEVCKETELEALLPLWKMERKTLLAELLTAGFKAIIVALNAEKLDPSFLGRVIDYNIIEELEKRGVDPCGENGEFHTVVVAGPLFKTPLNLEKHGDPILRSGYWFQDFSLKIAPTIEPVRFFSGNGSIEYTGDSKIHTASQNQ